ncbi:DUF2591 domain-containing protein [Salmonella enterica]|nr:DUF2591 domain-containing protein [Salmonella enterica]EEH8325664.1 DUF2591 domain-containing protein [Salmonella enterica]
MNYSKLSDFEINCLVAKATGHKPLDAEVGYQGTQETGNITAAIVRGPRWIGGFDPCNSPANAWPIIVGKKLSLINADDKWLCVPEDEPVNGVTGDAVHMIYSGDGVEHENPLRAAMIVFLLMQEPAYVQANPARPDIR